MLGPAVAIVIDPKRTISAGKVEIGAFRTYPDNYQGEKKTKNASGLEMINDEKLAEFGVHADRYY